MWEYLYSAEPKISSEKCNHRAGEIISYPYGNHILKKNEVGPRKIHQNSERKSPKHSWPNEYSFSRCSIQV